MNANPEIEVFYDGGCPVCRWELNLYDRMDKNQRIRWTPIESLTPSELPLGKTYDDLLGRFHVRDLKKSEGAQEPWYIGVDAFARIWRALPGLRHLAGLFSIPGIRQLTMFAYRIFLRWQSWHRRRRK